MQILMHREVKTFAQDHMNHSLGMGAPTGITFLWVLGHRGLSPRSIKRFIRRERGLISMKYRPYARDFLLMTLFNLHSNVGEKLQSWREVFF